MRNLGITGIITRKTKYSDFHEFITIYSPETGKIDALARGSRKLSSSFIGHLEILNICKFQIYKNGDRYSITQCQIINPFKHIKNNLRSTLHAFTILEIFNRVANGETHQKELFNLLETTLKSINDLNSSNPHHTNLENQILFRVEIFKIKALALAGSIPTISECAHCGEKWQDKAKIILDNENHFCCKKCQHKGNHSHRHTLSKQSPLKIDFNIMKLINYIYHQNYNQLSKISISAEHIQKLKQISDTFLHQYTQKEITSERITQEMKLASTS